MGGMVVNLHRLLGFPQLRHSVQDGSELVREYTDVLDWNPPVQHSSNSRTASLIVNISIRDTESLRVKFLYIVRALGATRTR